MARSPFTLAALASAAVAELDVVRTVAFGSPGDGNFDAAVVSGRDGRHWLIRVPRTERAEQEQSADLVGLAALSHGVRARLPFDVTTFAGQTPVGGTRAIVTEFLGGTPVRLGGIGVELADSIGSAIAALHNLPTSLVTDAGLPADGAAEAHRTASTLIERALATRVVPAALQARWEQAAHDSALWQFSPTVANGSLTAGSFLAADDAVVGLLGWHGLRSSDPARDLSWVLSARNPAVIDAVFDSYTRARGSIDRHLRQRATLLSELEVAKWLLHGTETRSTEIVDDAVRMLSNLVDEVQGDTSGSISPQTLPILAVDEVEALLERTERAS